MRIRTRLLILVFSMLIPSMVGTGLGIYYVYNEQQKSYREGIQELSSAMAVLLDKEMSERIRILQALARSPAILEDDLEGFYRFATQVAMNWDTAIMLSDTTGKHLFNTRLDYAATGLPGTTPSLLAQRRQYGAAAAIVSDVYYAPLGKGYSFAVEVPVVVNDQVRYHLSLVTFAWQLQRVFDHQNLPPGWIATILDREGVVAARSEEPEKFVGVTAAAGLREKMARLRSGTSDGTTLNGTQVTAFFSRAPVSGWTFVVSVPRDVLVAPARDATLAVAGIALLLLGLGLAAAFVIARRTARSMEELRRAAADVGQGKVIARQSSGVAEVDAVSMEMTRASEQIRNAKADLERRVADAVAVAEQSQKALLQSQKLEALGRLTGGIAHDFNNLMQTLTTGLQLMLLATASQPRLKGTAEACQRAVARATELTRQLMAFGRVQDAHISTLDLRRRLDEIKPLLSGGLRSDITLHYEIDAEVWPVTIDPMQFELALLNVVINARDAMPEGGEIRIRIHNVGPGAIGTGVPEGEHVRIAVIDSGHGMRADVLSKALDPFFTTKPVGKGSGMGLAQAYGFARQAGGSLVIDSAPGAGTTINFYLPRAHEATAPGGEPRADGGEARSRKGGRLLFVEDDLLVAAVVKPALQQAGFDVQEARSCEEALEKFKLEGPYDIVFSDIVTPGQISGIDLARYITNHASGTRVVLATGYTEQRLDTGGVEILAKPYDVEKAIEVLSAD